MIGATGTDRRLRTQTKRSPTSSSDRRQSRSQASRSCTASAKRAAPSYPTFFHRFASKEDLLADVAEEEVRQLLALGQSAMARSAPFPGRVIIGRGHVPPCPGPPSAVDDAAERQRFCRDARGIHADHPRHSPDPARANPWLPVGLAVTLVASSTFEILSWWLKQPEDHPLGHVARLFEALVVDVAARRCDIILD